MKQTWKKQHLEKNYHAKCYSFKSRRAKLPGEKVKLIWLKLRIQVGLEIRICMVCDYEFGDHLTFCKVICDDKYLSSMSTAFRYFLSNIFCSPQLIYFFCPFSSLNSKNVKEGFAFYQPENKLLVKCWRQHYLKLQWSHISDNWLDWSRERWAKQRPIHSARNWIPKLITNGSIWVYSSILVWYKEN